MTQTLTLLYTTRRQLQTELDLTIADSHVSYRRFVNNMATEVRLEQAIRTLTHAIAYVKSTC